MSILKFPALIINESLYIKQVMNNIINQCMKVVWSNCLLQLFLTKRFKICFGYHISYIISNVKKNVFNNFFLNWLILIKTKIYKTWYYKKKSITINYWISIPCLFFVYMYNVKLNGLYRRPVYISFILQPPSIIMLD